MTAYPNRLSRSDKLSVSASDSTRARASMFRFGKLKNSILENSQLGPIGSQDRLVRVTFSDGSTTRRTFPTAFSVSLGRNIQNFTLYFFSRSLPFTKSKIIEELWIDCSMHCSSEGGYSTIVMIILNQIISISRMKNLVVHASRHVFLYKTKMSDKWFERAAWLIDVKIIIRLEIVNTAAM